MDQFSCGKGNVQQHYTLMMSWFVGGMPEPGHLVVASEQLGGFLCLSEFVRLMHCIHAS